MINEKRKVEKVDDFYEVFKSISGRTDDFDIINYETKWERRGKKYTCKGLVDLLEVDRGIEFILSKEIVKDMMDYRRSCFDKKRDYLQRKDYQQR